jgi:hypothetical protein
MHSALLRVTALLPRSFPVPLRRAGKSEAKPIDWVGQWYTLDRVITKESIGIRFGKVVPGQNAVRWQFKCHVYGDAIGAIALLAKEDGYEGEVPLPALREKHKPGLLAGAGAQLRFLLRKSAPAPDWKSLDPSWQMPQKPLPASTAVATGALDVERTSRFAERARALGVSTNTLLLSALVKASRPFVREGSALWRMPVNMRGPVEGISPYANYCSFIEIPVGEDDSAPRLHQQIKTSFARREHWAAWFFCTIGNYVGIRGMQVVHRIYHAMSKGRPWVGTLSNLGTWNGVGEWYFAPGCQYASPLGAGVIVCAGKLLLALEAHPSIARDSAMPQALMDRWLAELGV